MMMMMEEVKTSEKWKQSFSISFWIPLDSDLTSRSQGQQTLLLGRVPPQTLLLAGIYHQIHVWDSHAGLNDIRAQNDSPATNDTTNDTNPTVISDMRYEIHQNGHCITSNPPQNLILAADQHHPDSQPQVLERAQIDFAWPTAARQSCDDSQTAPGCVPALQLFVLHVFQLMLETSSSVSVCNSWGTLWKQQFAENTTNKWQNTIEMMN